jgi:hypothetical protein
MCGGVSNGMSASCRDSAARILLSSRAKNSPLVRALEVKGSYTRPSNRSGVSCIVGRPISRTCYPTWSDLKYMLRCAIKAVLAAAHVRPG